MHTSWRKIIRKKSRMHSPIQSKLDQPTKSYKDNVPFAPVRPLFVDTLFHYTIAYGYIDDMITVVLEVRGWIVEALNTAHLVIHSLFRQIDKSDPLSRDGSISRRKLKWEGTSDERKIILGWMVDTRKFRISLPTDNAVEWICAIQRVLKATTVKTKELE